MDSYNKAALIRHMRKHETENQVFAAGPKGGRKNFDYPDGTWFTKDGSPKPSLPAVCEMCGSLRGGHLTYPCLHNNKMSWLCNLCYLKTLGYVKAAESWEISQFDKPDFSGYTGEINVKGNTIAPAGTIVYRSMLSSEPVGYWKKYDYTVLTSFSPTPTRYQSSQSYSKEMDYHIYAIDISGLDVFIVDPLKGNQGIIVVVLEPISVERIQPLNWDDDYYLSLRAEDEEDMRGIFGFPPEGQSLGDEVFGKREGDIWSYPWTPDLFSPVYPVVPGDMAYKETEQLRLYLEQGLVGQIIQLHQICRATDKTESDEVCPACKQSHPWWPTAGLTEALPSGSYGKVMGISEVNPNRAGVIGMWVKVTSGGTETHPIGSRMWIHIKDWVPAHGATRGWEKGNYLAEQELVVKNHNYVQELLEKYPNIPVVHATSIEQLTDPQTIYFIDFPLRMYRGVPKKYGIERALETGFLTGTNENFGMFFDNNFNNGEYMPESEFPTVPVAKVYGALTLEEPFGKYLTDDGQVLEIDLQGYYIVSVRGDVWDRWNDCISWAAVPAVLGFVNVDDIMILYEKGWEAETSTIPTLEITDDVNEHSTHRCKHCGGGIYYHTQGEDIGNQPVRESWCGDSEEGPDACYSSAKYHEPYEGEADGINATYKTSIREEPNLVYFEKAGGTVNLEDATDEMYKKWKRLYLFEGQYIGFSAEGDKCYICGTTKGTLYYAGKKGLLCHYCSEGGVKIRQFAAESKLLPIGWKVLPTGQLQKTFNFDEQNAFIPIWNTVFQTDALSAILKQPTETIVSEDSLNIRLGDSRRNMRSNMQFANILNEFVEE